MDAACRSVTHTDERHAADGEVAWFWRPEAGATCAMMLRITQATVTTKSGSPGRARRTPLKPLRREGRLFRLVPVVLPRAFFVARGPWVRRAPGLPCALCFQRGCDHWKNSDAK